MMAACAAPDPRLGLVQGLILTVDCGARGFAQSGYEALTRPPSALPALITAGLTLYVALLGWGLMTGRGPRLADTPQMAVKIGVVLALTASWPLFQLLVFRTAFDGADDLSGAITRQLPLTGGSAWTALQSAYDQLTAAAAHYGTEAGPDADPRQGGAALAADSLWIASGAQLISTLYVALAGKVMVAGLAAVGPLFIGLCMIPQTRGLFVGWIRALLVAAFLPLFAVLTCALALVMLEPRLALIGQATADRQLDLPQVVAATSLVLVCAAGALALAVGVVIAGVSFRLPDPIAPQPSLPTPTTRVETLALPSRAAAVAAGVEATMMRERLEQHTHGLERRIAGLASAPAQSSESSPDQPRSAPIARRLRKDRLR